MPRVNGSSGPTTVSPTFSFLAKRISLSKSVGSIGTLTPSTAVPALPGAQKMVPRTGDCASFQTKACSRPPLPITSTLTRSLIRSLSDPRPVGQLSGCAHTMDVVGEWSGGVGTRTHQGDEARPLSRRCPHPAGSPPIFIITTPQSSRGSRCQRSLPSRLGGFSRLVPHHWSAGWSRCRGDRIAAVQRHGNRAADIDLGDTAIVPGFVNAHTHLDLTGPRGLTAPTPDFVDWLKQVISYRRQRTPQQVAADVQVGMEESLRFGTTLVGDIAADGGDMGCFAQRTCRAVVFRELLGLPVERAETAWKGLRTWMASIESTATCRPGVSPHAPYSVGTELLVRAAMTGLPLAIHLAESQAEIDLLTDRRGPFVPFLKEMGVWAPDQLVNDLGRLLQLSHGATPFLLIHGNYLRPGSEIPPNASIVYCPRHPRRLRTPPAFISRVPRSRRSCCARARTASRPIRT